MTSNKDPDFDDADAISETLKDLPAEVRVRVKSAFHLVETAYELLKDLPAEVRAKALRSALYQLGVEAEEQVQETRSESAGKSVPGDKASPPPDGLWSTYFGEQLFRALDRNDRAAAEEALNYGASVYYAHDPESRSQSERVSAFCKALLSRNKEMVELFLDHGADANAELSDVCGYGEKRPISPLMLAVLEGCEGVVKVLLERGANPNYERESDGNMMSARPSPDAGSSSMITVLGAAVEKGSVKMVEMLLDSGASDKACEETLRSWNDMGFNEQESNTITALHWAKWHNEQNVVRFLEQRQGIKADKAEPEADDANAYARWADKVKAEEVESEMSRPVPPTQIIRPPIEWLECAEGNPSHAISLLRDDPSNLRKLFLAGCGWARRFWARLGKRSQTALEVFEQFADQEARVEGFFDGLLHQFLRFDVFAYLLQAHLSNDEEDAASPMGVYLNALLQAQGAWTSALSYINQPDAEREIVLPARGVYSLSRGAYIDASDEFYFASGHDAAEYQAQCDIILDVIGNPSRPVSLESTWLSSNQGAVAKIAQAVYDERAFDRLPELADALETSGCHNDQILAHCRTQGMHVRGCWVIDLLLAKDKLAFPLGKWMPLAFDPAESDQAIESASLENSLKDAQANTPSTSEAAPATGMRFNIEFTSEAKYSDDILGALIRGRITLGLDFEDFTTAMNSVSWSESDYERQWTEGALRIVGGYDRSALITKDGAAGWGGGVERWPMWRQGETVYMTRPEIIPLDVFDEANPYDHIESRQATAAKGGAQFLDVRVEDIKDFLLARGRVSRETLENLERPCAQCGEEIRRCNRCGNCLKCGGGVGNVELGYCRKCADVNEPLHT